MKTQLINSYLDYMSNNVSVEEFAMLHGITPYDAATIIQMGKKYREEEVQRVKDIALIKSGKHKEVVEEINSLDFVVDYMFETMAKITKPQ